jgi:hypothetical protein
MYTPRITVWPQLPRASDMYTCNVLQYRRTQRNLNTTCLHRKRPIARNIAQKKAETLPCCNPPPNPRWNGGQTGDPASGSCGSLPFLHRARAGGIRGRHFPLCSGQRSEPGAYLSSCLPLSQQLRKVSQFLSVGVSRVGLLEPSVSVKRFRAFFRALLRG